MNCVAVAPTSTLASAAPNSDDHRDQDQEERIISSRWREKERLRGKEIERARDLQIDRKIMSRVKERQRKRLALNNSKSC